ncbi:uncharacterized protein LOC143062551 [Mytilus galloprovincialis]|uniref:uncharacterized protein LOC143062551 n=1 Tax=Mytilus galloprovincialis TaxID=29158 RepID=UPI003F7C9FD9
MSLLRPSTMSKTHTSEQAIKDSEKRNHSIIIHEMLHALGGKHEMSRPDRDNYVQIMWDRLSMGANNFVKGSKVSTTYPYDMSSVLQYALRSFTKNGMETIVVKDWRLKFLASVGNDLMYYDIAEVNSVYKCADNCPSLGCKNGGFTLWNCTCYCPDVLTGDLCEQPISNNASCGGTINVPMGTEVTLTSPNYPNNYDTELSCTWIIKGVENNILRGTIVDMEISNNNYACYHWMEIRYNMMGQKGPERCGSTNHEVWDTTVDEEMNTMIIIFDSFVGSDKAPGRGFKMNFVSIGTGCLSNPCKFGSCDSPVNTDSYVCTCDYGFKGINCTELSEYASIGCTSEVGEYCVFMQEPTTDEMNWDTSSKAPYVYSGPQMAKEGFIFLYLHSSGKTASGDKAVMSTQIDFPKVDRCLSFWYHMYSYTAISMGFMNVFVSDSTGQDTSVFFKNASQGKQWLYQEIDIPAVDNLKVSFVGTRNGWMSYMAVDDIWLIPGTCASPLTSTTTTSTTTPTTSTPTTTTPTTTPTTTTPQTTTTPAPTTTTPTTTTTTTPTTTTPTTTTPTTTTPAPTTTTPTTTTPTTTTPTTTTPTTTMPTTTTATTTTPTTTTPTTTTPTTTTPTTTTPAPTTTTPTTTTPTTTTPTTTTNPAVTSTSGKLTHWWPSVVVCYLVGLLSL